MLRALRFVGRVICDLLAMIGRAVRITLAFLAWCVLILALSMA
jgi:hypothetical protein